MSWKAADGVGNKGDAEVILKIKVFWVINRFCRLFWRALKGKKKGRERGCFLRCICNFHKWVFGQTKWSWFGWSGRSFCKIIFLLILFFTNVLTNNWRILLVIVKTAFKYFINCASCSDFTLTVDEASLTIKVSCKSRDFFLLKAFISKTIEYFFDETLRQSY